MKKNLGLILISLLSFPKLVHAHGDEIFYSLGLAFNLILLSIGSIIFSRIGSNQKYLVSAAYGVTLVLVLVITWNLPYNANKRLINFNLWFTPLIVAIITFLIILNRNKGRIKQK